MKWFVIRWSPGYVSDEKRAERTLRGDVSLFWRPEKRGYTPDLLRAGLYTADDLKSACLRPYPTPERIYTDGFDEVIPLDEFIPALGELHATLRVVMQRAVES